MSFVIIVGVSGVRVMVVVGQDLEKLRLVSIWFCKYSYIRISSVNRLNEDINLM